MKKLVLMAIVMLSFLSLPSIVSASGPNYWTNTEYAELVYRGYIQFQSSYYDGALGGNVYNAYIRYQSNTRDTGRRYAGPSMSRTDSTIYKTSLIFRDDLCWSCPPTRFYYNFLVAPDNFWPLPQDEKWNIENMVEVGGMEIMR